MRKKTGTDRAIKIEKTRNTAHSGQPESRGDEVGGPDNISEQLHHRQPGSIPQQRSNLRGTAAQLPIPGPTCSVERLEEQFEDLGWREVTWS